MLEQIETTKKNLSAQISTNEGIKGFVESRVKDKLIEDSIGLFASDGKGGVQMLPVADKKQLKESLLPGITLPEGLVQKRYWTDFSRQIFTNFASLFIRRF